MEFVLEYSDRWLEIAVAVYLTGMMLYGHYKGFIRTAVSVAALFITFAAVHAALPRVTDWLKQETPVYEAMKNGMEKAVGLDETLKLTAPDGADGKADERMVIEELKLPEQLKKLLIENNNGEVYRLMGVDLFVDYIGGYLADTIIRIFVFVLLFLIIFILLQVLVVWLDLIAKLPILSGLNKIAGAALGLAEGMIFVWIACLVFTLMSGTEAGLSIMRQVDASPWLSWIYDHNMLSYVVVGLARSVL